MLVIEARNVNEALPVGMMYLREEGVPVESRGMQTVEYPTPVATVYARPDQCVLFDAQRDANPFFHFFEALWILGGRRDVASVAAFLPRIAQFSDGGESFHGAYGWRLRNSYQFDQIETVIHMLQELPDTRRAVISIYHPGLDLNKKSKDIPCNDMVMLLIRNGALNMTVCNRSNDIIWGAYGANAVQFSFLMQYIAGRVGVELGTYTQVSHSYHAYPDNPYWQATRDTKGVYFHDPYCSYEAKGLSSIWPIMQRCSSDLAAECSLLMQQIADGTGVLPTGLHNPLLTDVAYPMLKAYAFYKEGKFPAAIHHAFDIQPDDWRQACIHWLERREARRAA